MKNKTITYLIMALYLLSLVSALDTGDIKQTAEIASTETKNIQKSADKIQNEYLKKEWTKVIENNKYLGPINSFFKKINPLFLIILGYPYEISLIFFLTLIIWIFIVIVGFRIINASSIVRMPISVILSLIASTILAQILNFSNIASAILNLGLSQESWWKRVLIYTLIIAGFVVVFFVSKILEKNLKINKENKSKNKIVEDLKKVKAFNQGLKEANEI